MAPPQLGCLEHSVNMSEAPIGPRTLGVEPYAVQAARWPTAGKCLLAQFDQRSVVVYQAYGPSIARAAVSDQRLGGGGFRFGRMSWVKPNFLWMMYRSGWATKEGQECVLAIHIAREGFDRLLDQAVHSTWHAHLYPTQEEWAHAVDSSAVRLQWDPDHDPEGAPVGRRALQLGLRGLALESFVRNWTLQIEDITTFVAAQRAISPAALICPREDEYPLAPDIRRRLAMDPQD